MFGWIDLKVDNTVNFMNKLDYQVSNLDCANIDKMELKRELSSTGVWNQLNLKESLLRQKARYQWLKEGDRNYRYFYSHES